MNVISAAQSGAGLGMVSSSRSRGQTRSNDSNSTLNILLDACRRSDGLLVLTSIEQFEQLLKEGAQNDVIVNAKQGDGTYKNQCRYKNNAEWLVFEIYTEVPLRFK